MVKRDRKEAKREGNGGEEELKVVRVGEGVWWEWIRGDKLTLNYTNIYFHISLRVGECFFFVILSE